VPVQTAKKLILRSISCSKTSFFCQTSLWPLACTRPTCMKCRPGHTSAARGKQLCGNGKATIQQTPGIKHQPRTRRRLSALHAVLNHPTGPMPIFPGSFAIHHSREAWISCKQLPVQVHTCCSLQREKERRVLFFHNFEGMQIGVDKLEAAQKPRPCLAAVWLMVTAPSPFVSI